METARSKRPKIRSASSAAIPMPSSLTVNRATSSLRPTATCTGFPAPYLRAFESKFDSTCSRRSRSHSPRNRLRARLDRERAARACGWNRERFDAGRKGETHHRPALQVSEVREALRYLEKGHARGKVVIIVD